MTDRFWSEVRADIARIRHRGGLCHSRISIYTYEGGRSSSVSHLPSISKNGAFQPARTFVGFLTYRTAYNTYTLQKKTTTSEGVISFVQVIIGASRHGTASRSVEFEIFLPQ